MPTYDSGYKPPRWWLDVAEPVINTDWKGRRDELADRARAASGSDKEWDGTRITKLLKGDNGTLKMVIGISRVIGVPPPVFEADTIEVARALQQKANSLIPVEKSTPDPGNKITKVEQALEASIEAAKDQTKPLRSKNEGSPRGLGHRRASTRR